MLTSGTSLHRVCQAISPYGSTSYLDMGDYKGRTGPTTCRPTPQLWSTRQTKVASSLDTTSMLSATNLALIRVVRLYQGPLLEYPPRGRKTNPQTRVKLIYPKDLYTHLVGEPIEAQVFVEVQDRETPTSLALPRSLSSHISLLTFTSYLGP